MLGVFRQEVGEKIDIAVLAMIDDIAVAGREADSVPMWQRMGKQELVPHSVWHQLAVHRIGFRHGLPAFGQHRAQTVAEAALHNGIPASGKHDAGRGNLFFTCLRIVGLVADAQPFLNRHFHRRIARRRHGHGVIIHLDGEYLEFVEVHFQTPGTRNQDVRRSHEARVGEIERDIQAISADRRCRREGGRERGYDGPQK